LREDAPDLVVQVQNGATKETRLSRKRLGTVFLKQKSSVWNKKRHRKPRLSAKKEESKRAKMPSIIRGKIAILQY